MLLLGARAFCGFPAPALSSLMSEGILKTTQCHHPLPVGASGSYTVTAKLSAFSGALTHLRAGEMFFPLQPNPENTWVSVNCPLKSSLFKVNSWAYALPTPRSPNTATVKASFFILSLLSLFGLLPPNLLLCTTSPFAGDGQLSEYTLYSRRLACQTFDAESEGKADECRPSTGRTWYDGRGNSCPSRGGMAVTRPGRRRTCFWLQSGRTSRHQAGPAAGPVIIARRGGSVVPGR